MGFTVAGLPLAAGLDSLLVYVVAFLIISAVRAIHQARQARERHGASTDTTAEEQRARELRERIRRMAAERQAQENAGRGNETYSPPLPPPVPSSRPRRVPPLEPFGGPLGRMLGEVQRKVQGPAPSTLERREIKRDMAAEAASIPQEDLGKRVEEERKRFREERDEVWRQAATPAEPIESHGRQGRPTPRETAATDADTQRRIEARNRLLEDLREPASVRRAILLREVLGTPVGLRR